MEKKRSGFLARSIMGVWGVVMLSLMGACTKTAGVVTDVNPVSEGLMVTKCDEIVYWDLYILIMGQGNCRNEIARK